MDLIRSRWFPCALAFAAVLALVGPPALASSIYGAGLFQLGDGQQPAGFAGAARIEGTAEQAGPDWADVFDANGMPVSGLAAYGGRWAVFVADDVSLGSGFESTAVAGSFDWVCNGTASINDDIGNAYAYAAADATGSPALFLGVERLSDADGWVELELSQQAVHIGLGGYGRNQPWEVIAPRAAGDLLVRLDFVSGALAGAQVSAWAGSWLPLVATAGEGCDEAQTLCAVTNAAAIGGGPWINHDTGGDSEQISPGRFVEVGIDLGMLLGADPSWSSLRVLTPGDMAFGFIREGM